MKFIRIIILIVLLQPSLFLQALQASLDHDPILLIHGLDASLGVQLDIVQYADFDGDRKIGFSDFALFAQEFGKPSPDLRFDLNNDGKLSLTDFVIFIGVYGKETKPLEATWDALSDGLITQLGWKDGGTIGSRIHTAIEPADFYKVRLSSGDNLTFSQQGDEIADAVKKIHSTTSRHVILIGFSMGGLSARACLQDHIDAASLVSALVTICSPHQGSHLAYLTEPEARSLREAFLGSPISLILDLYLYLKGSEKKAIKHLKPDSEELVELNANIHRMPSNIPYVSSVSNIVDISLKARFVDAVARYKDTYSKFNMIVNDSLVTLTLGVRD